MDAPPSTLYSKVVQITRLYLGPAAERFVDRQIQSHLNMPPVSLRTQDLKKLLDWMQIAMSLITEDSGLIEEYMTKLEYLVIDNKEGRVSK